MNKIYICRPDFSLHHFKINIIDSKWGFDWLCFIHAVTFGIIFIERIGHCKANKIHRGLKFHATTGMENLGYIYKYKKEI